MVAGQQPEGRGGEGMGSLGNGELWGATGLGAPSHKLREQPWPRSGEVPSLSKVCSGFSSWHLLLSATLLVNPQTERRDLPACPYPSAPHRTSPNKIPVADKRVLCLSQAWLLPAGMGRRGQQGSVLPPGFVPRPAGTGANASPSSPSSSHGSCEGRGCKAPSSAFSCMAIIPISTKWLFWCYSNLWKARFCPQLYGSGRKTVLKINCEIRFFFFFRLRYFNI